MTQHLLTEAAAEPHFASASSEWTTPQALFDSLDKIFHFETDVCATAANTKCSRYYTTEDDGLAQEWRGVCWCNPPYGRGLGIWVRKAFEAAENGATVVMLLPAYTGNAWWQDFVIPHGEVLLLRGRLQYGGVAFPAPFSSCIVVFSKTFTGKLLRCIACKNPFTANRSHAKVCSNRCQVRLHRKELRAHRSRQVAA
jgi:phage N-6-adenine-methyltransferase